MPRAFRFGNYAVYIYDERGAAHHRPHAHIKFRSQRVASVFLETLEVFLALESLPADLIEQLRTHQDSMLDLWTELNEPD
jgi:hypothetical protein